MFNDKSYDVGGHVAKWVVIYPAGVFFCKSMN